MNVTLQLLDIYRFVENEFLHGVMACSRGFCLSLLLFFFANDNLIFCRASFERNVILCKKIIGVYKKASGQLLNQAKTSLFCNKNTPLDIQEEFKTKFDAKVICQHEKYLGLPSLLGRSKRKTFLDLKEKLANKLVGLKENSYPK